jgi:hypothetical protein
VSLLSVNRQVGVEVVALVSLKHLFFFLFNAEKNQYILLLVLDIGRVGNDKMAYIATVEPFHGNVIAVYTKQVIPFWRF